MTRQLALELAPQVRVNAVAPHATRPKISASSKIDPFVGSEEPFWRPKF